MAERRDPVPPQAKREALRILASGKVSLPDLAQYMGESTQTLWNWCRIAKVDWRRARQRVVARECQKVHR
jgi:DNA-binding transcriptional regulator YiaG